MRRLALSMALLWALASLTSAQAPAPTRATSPAARQPTRPATPATPPIFEKYCFECHGSSRTEADLSIEQLVQKTAKTSIGAHWSDWERVYEMLDSGLMPPPGVASTKPPITSKTRSGHSSTPARLRSPTKAW